jgi:chromate transporter
VPNQSEPKKGGAWEVFRSFLKLGCTAFGGPVAHLGYFHREFVERRRWITEEDYADLVALCQFLPGPASSQTGIAIGWRRAGRAGAFAAWAAFTLPSAILMTALALGIRGVGGLGHAGWVQGLKIAAVAVVAQAVVAMARRLCPDAPRVAIAVAAAVVLSLTQSGLAQPAVIAGGAVAGLLLGRWFDGVGPTNGARPPTSRSSGWTSLCLFAGLLLLLPAAARLFQAPWLQVASGFYRSGALVFGGGHVVLPLLQKATVGKGWIGQDAFLAGYGAAQALPGPLFAFSAYLGAIIAPGGVGGAVLALVAIYLPAVFVLFAALPHWERLRAWAPARLLLGGANAAVVGLLAAAFYSPIWTSTVTDPRSAILASAAFAALQFGRAPPWLAVACCAAAGAWIL